MTHPAASSRRLVALTAPLLALALALTASAGSAHADRFVVRVGGHAGFHAHAHFHVHVGGGYHVRVGVRPHAHYYRTWFGPRYYWGIRFAAPPPPPPTCEYECGTSAYYYESQPAAPVAVATQPMPPPEPELPTLGLGAFFGSSSVSHNDAGDDFGLVGRLRLTQHLRLEGELSKTKLDGGARVDRRGGAALLWDFSPYATLSPYVLAGGGIGITDTDGSGTKAHQGYGEVGVGLEWRLSDRLSIIGDLRAGQIANQRDNNVVALSTSPASVDQKEDFTRARIGALVFF